MKRGREDDDDEGDDTVGKAAKVKDGKNKKAKSAHAGAVG